MKESIYTFFFLCAISASAQDTLSKRGPDFHRGRRDIYRTDIYRTDIYRFADATMHTYLRPLDWQSKQWLTLGGLIVGTAAITLLDKPVRHLFLVSEHNFPEIVEDIGYHYGKPYSAVVFAGGFYIAGLIINDQWAKDTGLNLGATVLTSGLLQTVFKDVIGRARPGTEAGPYKFKVPAKGNIGYHSFPSGHSAVAIGITLVLAERIKSTPIKIILYALAASTVLSRLHADQHWLSDITFGAALAAVCNKTVSKRLSMSRSSRQSMSINWTLAPARNGLAVIGRF